MSYATRLGGEALFAAALMAPAAARSDEIDPGGRAMLLRAQEVVAAYHAGAPRSGATLSVVYFITADGEPLRAHTERLDRVMADVNDFYRDGLRRFGIETDGIPLERDGGKLTLHIVRGKPPASEYHYSSEDETIAEVRNAMKGTFDLDREHVLICYALCRREPDGRYVFDAPYYGEDSQRSGVCNAADCELLDPALLRDTRRKIVYTEHYYPLVEESVARFNTKYLGGTEHELGHGLGLPHDNGNPVERQSGVSLLGWGNLSYRSNDWGAEPTSHLSRATALRLVSHPLVTGSDRGRRDDARGRFDGLRFSRVSGTVRLEATLAGDIPPTPRSPTSGRPATRPITALAPTRRCSSRAVPSRWTSRGSRPHLSPQARRPARQRGGVDTDANDHHQSRRRPRVGRPGRPRRPTRRAGREDAQPRGPGFAERPGHRLLEDARGETPPWPAPLDPRAPAADRRLRFDRRPRVAR